MEKHEADSIIEACLIVGNNIGKHYTELNWALINKDRSETCRAILAIIKKTVRLKLSGNTPKLAKQVLDAMNYEILKLLLRQGRHGISAILFGR